MSNLLPQPYCEFHPEEWTEATGVLSAEETSDSSISAIELDCPFKSKSSCPVHGSIKGQSASEGANKLLKHFAKSPPQGIDNLRYYTISGIEVAGFDLQGQTLYAEQAKEINLRHFIVHGPFSIARGAIANRLTLANSLFCGPINAYKCQIYEQLSLNHSRIEGSASFDNAELQGGLELRNSKIEGSVNLNNVTIAGDLDLSQAEISGNLNLSQARILGNLKMSKTQIEGDCNLPQVQIEGEVEAQGLKTESIDLGLATVGGHLLLSDITASQFNCESIHIEGSLNLIFADIKNDVNCKAVNIEGETRIMGLDVGADVILKNSQINHLARIWQTEINGTLNLDSVDAQHHLKISNSEVESDLILAAAELGSFTPISNVEIKGDLLVDTMNSTGVVVFNNITLRGDAKLRDISVEEYFRFSESHIDGNCDLSEARTKERTEFVDTRINGGIIATGAIIGQRLDIYGCHVSEAVQFIGSQIGAFHINPDSVIGGLNLTGSRITHKPLDVTGIRVLGDVVLDEAVVEREARIDDVTTQTISMEKCSINGSLTATNLRVGYPLKSGLLEADQLSVDGNVDFTNARIGDDFRLTRATISGNFTLDSSWIRGEFRCGESHLCGEIVASNVNWDDVKLGGTTLGDDFLLFNATLSGGITAYQLTSKGDIVHILRSYIPDGINIENASFSGDFVVSRSDTKIRGEKGWESSNTDHAVIQASGVTITGELLLESNLIHGDVDLSEAAVDGQLRIAKNEDDHATIIGGEVNLNGSIIEQQLILKSVNVHEGILATDIRVGSKTIVENVRGKQLDFDEGFFKWNVNLEEVYANDIDFTDTTLRNDFTVTNTVVSQAPLSLENARIHNAEINRGFFETQIDCSDATIEELTVNDFDEATIWDDIKINKTRFDGFDFTDFTASLHKIKHRIHYNRDAGPIHRRFMRFCSTFGRRLVKGFDLASTPIPTRDLDIMRTFRDDHLDREITYRRAKDSADSTSDNTAASEFYRLEKKHRRRRRFWEIIGGGERTLSNIASYGANFLLGAASGHGERISYVGYSAGLFMIFFTVLYVIAAKPIATSTPTGDATVIQSLLMTKPSIDYFFLSVASFVNIPGTIPDTAPQSIRFISYIERFIGTAYIPLLVFTLTRSLHR